MRKQKGFSLIELLIVVAIILIIAAIAIPSLLRARIAANEASAVASLRTLNTAQISYSSSYPTVGFATTLASLAGTNCAPPGSSGACIIDSLLAGGSKSGYSFASSESIMHRSEEHTSELQSPDHLLCRLLLEKKNKYLRMP